MIESPFESRARSAIVQLWEWVGEQRDIQNSRSREATERFAKDTAIARRNAYSNVRLYMRKFFAGLIDFDSEEQTNGKEFSGTVRGS